MELSTYYPPNYSQKTYRKKDLSPQQIKFCEAFVAHEYPSSAAKIAGYRSPARASAYLLKTKRITDHIGYLIGKTVNVPVTYESKLNVLDRLMDKAIAQQMTQEKPNVALIDRGLEAIDMMNKMQGHYAPEQSQSVNINVKATQDKMLEAKKAYEEY